MRAYNWTSLWLTAKYCYLRQICIIVVLTQHVSQTIVFLCSSYHRATWESWACDQGWTCNTYNMRTYCRSELYLCSGVLIVKSKRYKNVIVLIFIDVFWHSGKSETSVCLLWQTGPLWVIPGRCCQLLYPGNDLSQLDKYMGVFF